MGIIQPETRVRIALVGAGNRTRTIYQPLLPALRPWVEVVAVCDPVQEHCGALAEALGVPAYLRIQDLVRDRPMEAALVVAPAEAHHAISVTLSSHGVHNHIETPWASMLCQARQMVATARRHGVVVRAAENFLRFPIDRFAQTVRDSGYLGRIGRVLSYADHTGYHNNSRWIAFARCHPLWVQCIEHAMAHPAFYSLPQRLHREEKLSARFFGFPGDLLVMDIGSGHAKGYLGRHARPGYTEWQGERGTLVYRAPGATWGDGKAELRRCSASVLAPWQEAHERLSGGGAADVVTPVGLEMAEGEWLGIGAETPEGRLEYASPFRTGAVGIHTDAGYGAAIMDHVSDFALAVRGLRASEFDDEDALASQMMEAGARESALQEGRRVPLPLAGDLEVDQLTRANLRARLGADPMDVEAMLAISYPRA